MRLRVPELLAERGMTAYQMWKASNGRLSKSAAYRLAGGVFGEISAGTLDVLCDVFQINDPGPLFERDTPKRRR